MAVSVTKQYRVNVLRTKLRSKEISTGWVEFKDGRFVFCYPYTVKQCLRWHFPIIVMQKGMHVFYERAAMDAYYGGNSYQLFEDANDVAGLSEHFADRTEVKV